MRTEAGGRDTKAKNNGFISGTKQNPFYFFMECQIMVVQKWWLYSVVWIRI
jgi:hypothetical protein